VILVFQLNITFGCFMDYGINITFDKNVSSTERISFYINFYTHDVLKKENIYSKKEDNDEFVITFALRI
jgi:hypothetical protein